MQTMRDNFLDLVYNEMLQDDTIYFLTADFGAPALDRMRAEFKDRVLNVGVAEQNLINTAVGLAKEGATVFCFAIAPFITMRCFEQIRTCVSVFSLYKNIKIQLIGVGAGFSYDLSGPTHHCLEDINIIRCLPRVMVHSPADTGLFSTAFRYFMDNGSIVYHRFDSKPQTVLEIDETNVFEDGFRQLLKEEGARELFVSTGYASQVCFQNLKEHRKHPADLIDVYLIGKYPGDRLKKTIESYDKITVVSEEFRYASGLGTFITAGLENIPSLNIIGFDDYDIKLGGRKDIWARANIDIK
jgi:transketolase